MPKYLFLGFLVLFVTVYAQGNQSKSAQRLDYERRLAEQTKREAETQLWYQEQYEAQQKFARREEEKRELTKEWAKYRGLNEPLQIRFKGEEPPRRVPLGISEEEARRRIAERKNKEMERQRQKTIYELRKALKKRPLIIFPRMGPFGF